MASGAYGPGMKALADGTADFSADTIKVMLLATDTPYSFNADHDHIDDINASELSVSGYTSGFAGSGRKTLGSKTITYDSANNRVVFDAADPSAWTLATGKTVASAVVYWHNTDDATSIPLWFLDPTDVTTNGGTVTLTFDANGIGYQSV